LRGRAGQESGAPFCLSRVNGFDVRATPGPAPAAGQCNSRPFPAAGPAIAAGWFGTGPEAGNGLDPHLGRPSRRDFRVRVPLMGLIVS